MGTLLTKMEARLMIKRVSIFYLITLGIGMLLSLVSRLIFSNNNDVLWHITSLYNEVVCVCVLSLIPVSPIMLIVAIIRNKQQLIFHILVMIVLLICFFIYICVWVYCSGGV